MPQLTRPQMESRRKGAVPLLRSDISQRDVARRMGVSSTTVSRWARSLAGGGDLKATKTPGRPVRLKRELIVQAYNEHGGPMTVFAFTDLLQERFAVTYDPVHLGRLMTRLGLAKKYPRATKAMRALMGAKI